MKSVLFIINPHSGRNRNKQVEKTAMDLLSPDLFTVDFVYTRYAGHALELSRLGVAKGYDIIVAVGGDGTIHEVSQSVIHSNSAMAVIPMGSGNGFARFFEIPSSIKRAVKVIAEGVSPYTTIVLPDCITELACITPSTTFSGAKSPPIPSMPILILEQLVYSADCFSTSNLPL